ncbi:hypothetical protein FKP32DRAFT_74800 [Trametes sanguinea]|nr:hypothetical protein FKP32DRAFT_74800 [Trametes sanguinea]
MSTTVTPSEDDAVVQDASSDSRLARHWHGPAIQVTMPHSSVVPSPFSSPTPEHERPDVHRSGTFGHGHPNVVGKPRADTFGHGHVTVELFTVVSPLSSPATPVRSPLSSCASRRSGRLCGGDDGRGNGATDESPDLLGQSATEEAGEQALRPSRQLVRALASMRSPALC